MKRANQTSISQPGESDHLGAAKRTSSPLKLPMRFLLPLLVLINLLSACHAAVTRLPKSDLKILRVATNFHQVTSSTNLPRAVYLLCADDRSELADPGQNWQTTDAISDDTLPRKRVIWAVTNNEYCVVHYERGGRGHSFHFLVAKLENGAGKPSLVWRAAGGQLKDFQAFLDALAANKLDDSLDLAH